LSRGTLTGWARRAYLSLLVAGFAAAFILYLIDSGVAAEPGEGALVPALVRSSGALLPAAAREWIGVSFSTGGGAPDLPGIRVASGAPAESLLLYGWIGVFLLAFTVTVEPFFRAATGTESKWTRLVPFAALAGLPPFFLHSQPSDLPMLALSTLCLLFMLTRRWVLYGIALAAAALNSGAAAVFPVVFALHFGRGGRMERRWFLALLLGQGAAVVLLLWVSAAFAGRPQGTAGIDRWAMLSQSLQTYRMETAVAWIAVILAAAFDWGEKPVFLKTAAGAVLPLAASSALFGFPAGMRPAFALYPAALSLVLFPFLRRLERGGAPAPLGHGGATEAP